MFNTSSIKENINRIIYIEKSLLDHTESFYLKKHKNYNNFLWIKSSGWPIGYYKKLSKISGISAFPEKSLNVWLQVLRNKGKGFKKRIGLFLRIPFMKKDKLGIGADFYFNKVNFGILIYCDDAIKRVVKFNQTNNLEHARHKIGNEVESLKKANSIIHDVVYTPKLKSYYDKEDVIFFEQELILGKDLHRLSKDKVIKVYDDVFDFMYLYYTKCEIKAEPIINKDYLNNPIVEKHFCKLDNGEEILKKFREILKRNKKMLIGRIHGDLSLSNILIDRNNKVVILDWGESSEEYLSKDMKEHKRNTTYLYDKIVKENNFIKDELYNLSDQIFVGIFDEISKLLYNHYVNKVFDPYLNSKIHTKLRQFNTLA